MRNQSTHVPHTERIRGLIGKTVKLEFTDSSGTAPYADAPVAMPRAPWHRARTAIELSLLFSCTAVITGALAYLGVDFR